MKIKISTFISLIVLGMVFAASTSYAQGMISEGNVNATIERPPNSALFGEGEEFEIEATAICNRSSCGIMELYILYCFGINCDLFEGIETTPSAGIYSKDKIPHKCLNVKKGQKCSKIWRAEARGVGIYKLQLYAASTNAPPGYSDIIPIEIGGCGDGECSEDETYTNCPGDCCDSDCTATYDILCHSACDGHNGCLITTGCDGKTRGYRSCISKDSFIDCCDKVITTCEYKEYCLDAACTKCSDACDNHCESEICYGRDPDCDRQGGATTPCCGNGIVELGEECERDATGTPCDGRCRYDCICATSVTTSTITDATSPSSTSTIPDPDVTTSTTIYDPDVTTSTTIPDPDVTTTTLLDPGVTTSISLPDSTSTSTTLVVNGTGIIGQIMNLDTSLIMEQIMELDPMLIIPLIILAVLIPVILLAAFLYFYIKRRRKNEPVSGVEPAGGFKEDGVSRWIKGRLDAGEDPQLLKRGVAEAGLDPRIVDDVLKRK